MNRSICLFLTIMVLGLIITGCSASSPTQATPNEFSSAAASSQESEPVALTVYVERGSIDGAPPPPLMQALSKFEEQNPQIKITYETPPAGFNDSAEREAIIARLNTEIMAGKGPDLFILENIRVTNFNLFPDIEKAIRNGAFYDLTKELAKNGVEREDFVEGLFEGGQYEGAQYVVPLSFSTLCALADQNQLLESGFDPEAAQADTAAFFAELRRLNSQRPLKLYLNADLTTNMELPMLDYDAVKVNLDRPETIAMLELEQDVFLDQWNTHGLLDIHSIDFAKEMGAGDPFMMIMTWPVTVNAAWQLAANGAVPWMMAVPNETGHVTAMLESYGIVNSNTEHPTEAAALLAYLLSEECQRAGAYPMSQISFPVRKGCVEDALSAIQKYLKNPEWTLEATSDDRAELQALYGAPLPQQTIAQLEDTFEQISAVRFHPIWETSVQLGTDEDGNQLISSTMEKWIWGEISIDDFLETLQPRLEFYLDE